MKYFLTLALVVSSVFYAFSQTAVGLIAHYPFDTAYIDITGNSANTGIPVGTSFSCGVDGNALLLDGVDDKVSFIGQVRDEFDTEDFSISFYFKATGFNGTQYLMSKRALDCSSENVFSIRYVPNSKTINCLLLENGSKSVSITKKVEEGACWQHLVLIRDATRLKLYFNGEFLDEMGTVSRVDIENDGNLILGSTECFSQNEVPFQGLIDDLRVYNRALSEQEIEALYLRPDKILSADTTIFLGNSVDIFYNNACNDLFSWSPPDDVDSPTEAEPIITPSKEGINTYIINASNSGIPCTATDSIRINVVDPDDLDCNEVFLPKAFTPNGDGLNEIYRISNPFAIQELISFEIFDRWGGRVFFTDDPFEGWDGSFKGQAVNPGVMLYKVRFVCEDEEQIITGSITILR